MVKVHVGYSKSSGYDLGAINPTYTSEPPLKRRKRPKAIKHVEAPKTEGQTGQLRIKENEQ